MMRRKTQKRIAYR
jgi:site-specific recombinase XerD